MTEGHMRDMQGKILRIRDNLHRLEPLWDELVTVSLSSWPSTLGERLQALFDRVLEDPESPVLLGSQREKLLVA